MTRIAIGIVTILIVSAIVVLIARTKKSWEEGPRELRQDMWKMQKEIDQIKKQLADMADRKDDKCLE